MLQRRRTDVGTGSQAGPGRVAPPEGGQPVGTGAAREPAERLEQQVETVDQQQAPAPARRATASSSSRATARASSVASTLPSPPCRSPARSRSTASRGSPTAWTVPALVEGVEPGGEQRRRAA